MEMAAIENLLDQVTIRYARRAKCDEEWNSIPHVHPYLELFYVNKGRGQLQLEDELCQVKAGDLFYINSQIRHTELADTDRSFAYYVLALEGLSIRADQTSSASPYPSGFLHLYANLQPTGSHAPYIESLLSSLVDEWQNQRSYRSLCLSSLLRLLLIDIFRLNDEKLELLAGSAPDKQVTYAKQFIDIHYARPLSLDELAQVVYLNKYHLSHEFKRVYHCPPMAYLSQRRIEVAQELLLTTSLSMEEVAEAVGFNSQSYFNQAFKKNTGKTPTAFKKEHKRQKS